MSLLEQSLPQAVDLEQAILGALLGDKDAYYQVAGIIKEDSFYDPRNRLVFRIIQDLVNENSPVDLILVTQRLKQDGLLDKVDGPLYVTKLMDKVILSMNVGRYARIVQQKAIARKFIDVTAKRNRQMYDETDDVDDVLAGMQNDLAMVMGEGLEEESSITTGVEEVRELIEKNRSSSGLTGIGTGITKLDYFTGGLQPSDFIVVAAESGQGKTSLGVSIVKNAVTQFGAKAAIYSLEMSRKQITARILAAETGIPVKQILTKKLSAEEVLQVHHIGEYVKDLPIYFDERSVSSIEQICNSIRKLKLKYGVEVVLVDYIQLISYGGSGKTEEGQLAYIARRLKNLAKELNIAVIALSQLSRDKDNPKPLKSRLRGSGQIEEAADIVMLLYRPEAYGIGEFDAPFNGVPTRGLAEVSVAKGRNVGTGAFLLRFDAETTSFVNYQSEMPGKLLNVASSSSNQMDGPF